jgi:polyphosphate kinase 2 (PPK2 family)
MTQSPIDGKPPAQDRIQAELLDNFDEELELEIDDQRLDALTNEFSGHTARETIDRRLYFKELIRLQGELVKLQNWVQHHKLKVVVIFEGRDSAGKGGVIKRITQRLNPRVCRVASAPSGISSAMCRICRPAAKSCCSTAAGTTAPASRG